MSTHNCWEVADAVIGVSQRILLRGKPGTGKTYHAVHSALKENQKVYTITMTEETPAAELRGHYVPKGGNFIWSDGPAIRAWREGARLVINEIDRASEDVLSLMYAILDDPDFAELTLPTGEKIRPKEGFQVIATMNGVPDDLPDALQDRLPVDIEITDINPKALERLPEDLRGPAKNTTLVQNEERGISIRMWLEYAQLREELPKRFDKKDENKALEYAAQAVFGDLWRDAINMLKIGEKTSPVFDMNGSELTVEDIAFIREMKTLVAQRNHSKFPSAEWLNKYLHNTFERFVDQKLFLGYEEVTSSNAVLIRPDNTRISLLSFVELVS